MNHHFRATARGTIFVLLSFFISACATYGFADADRDGDAPVVIVETLVAPADLSLDHSALRTAFIDELERRGARVVSTGAGASLRCEIIDNRSTAFGDGLFAELDLACHIRPTEAGQRGTSFRSTGQATDAASQGATMGLSDTSRATSRAVIDAFSRIAPDIISYLDDRADP